MKDKLILLSGGMDSGVLLAEFKDQIALAISFNYGSKHNDRENDAAKNLAVMYGVPHHIIRIDFNDMGIKSDLLLSGGDIPHGHYEDESMKQTVVPFRNGIMLSIAAAIAESNKLKYILIANHAGDHAIYPDCRQDFMSSMNVAIQEGTYERVQILAPYTFISKRDIGFKGKALGFDFTNTYSCYEGNGEHCGQCGTCVERKEALLGFDPTVYKKWL